MAPGIVQRLETPKRKSAYHRHVNPRVAGHSVGDPLTSGSAPILPRHRQIDARFIDERHALERNRTDLDLVVVAGLPNLFGVTFGSLDGLFFVSDPSVSACGRASPKRSFFTNQIARAGFHPGSVQGEPQHRKLWRARYRHVAVDGLESSRCGACLEGQPSTSCDYLFAE